MSNLPAVVIPTQGDREILAALRAIKQRLDALTTTATKTAGAYNAITAGTANGSVVLQTSAGQVGMSADDFNELLRRSNLYRDVMRKLDDPARFDDYDARVKQLLLPDLSEIAAARAADIQRTEYRIQTAEESFAAQVTQITAAIEQSAAGVRETLFATANNMRTTAGRVTQVKARLNGFNGGTASVEQVMTAVSDRTTGLEAQYTLKVNAGGAYAAIGVAATSNAAGVNDSAIILVANKLAFVTPTAVVGTGAGQVNPTNPDLSLIPFGADANGAYINGTLRVNSGGSPLSAFTTRGSIDGYGSRFGIYLSGTGNTADPWPTGAGSNTEKANAVLWNILKGTALTSLASTAHLLMGDTVSLADAATPTTVEIRQWNGTSWVKPGVLVNGNLIVVGNLAALTANLGYINGTGSINLDGGIRCKGVGTQLGALYPGTTSTISINGNWNKEAVIGVQGESNATLATQSNIPGAGVKGIGSSTDAYGVWGTATWIGGQFSGNTYGVRATSPNIAILGTSTHNTNPGIYAANYSGGQALYSDGRAVAQASSGDTALTGTSTANTTHGVRGNNTAANSSGLVGASNGYNFYADGASTADYGTFTGAHDALMTFPQQRVTEVGDIVIEAGVRGRHGMSNSITEVKRSTKANEKGALGVYVGTGHLVDFTPNGLRGLTEGERDTIRATYDYVIVNAVGEGDINVCGQGGNIEIGDLIVCSNMPGKGMKQADDIVRGYTVAKARENVTFANPAEVKRIACIYLAG